MPHSDTGERVTPVLDFPLRDGLVVQAIRESVVLKAETRFSDRLERQLAAA